MQGYVESFPGVLLLAPVLATFLDLFEALNTESQVVFDSLSHPIRLATHRQGTDTIFLPSRSESKLKILADLSNLFQDTFVYASLLSAETLHRNFEGYRVQLHQHQAN
jgi:hypothetical protein